MSGVLLDELVTPERFGKFISVGATGAVLDITVSSVLTLGGVPPEYAKLVGAECAIVLMFFINDRWTFPDHGMTGALAKLRRLLKSNVVRSGGLVVQFLVVRALTGQDISVVIFGTDIWAMLTFPVAIACAVLFNYVAESLFTWKVTAED